MECYDEFNTENDKPQRQNYTDVEDSESKDLPTNLFYKRIAPTLPKADMVILRSSPKVAGRSYRLAP